VDFEGEVIFWFELNEKARVMRAFLLIFVEYLRRSFDPFWFETAP
jgi:hypothetical protein